MRRNWNLSGLSSIDPRDVELPHGTEVVTCAVVELADRVLPMGAVGRVAESRGDRVVVDLVGVGLLELARRDVAPRKVGQARFAARRADAWGALSSTIVLRATVGSRAWGLADERSDVDERGVFALPLGWTVGLAERTVDLVSADGSQTFWEIEKAIRQALRADPNTLETLFVTSACATDDVGAWLLEERDAFVSREIFGSFARYAVSQLRRLEQSARLAEHRVTVLAWLRAEPSSTLDQIAARLAAATLGDAATGVVRARDYVKQLYRSMHDQALLPACDFASLVAFARTSDAVDGALPEFELPRELRPKNAYNLLRLLYLAEDWLRDGAPSFVATGARRDRLLAIKRSEVALADVLREATERLPGLEDARNTTALPARPDVARADRLLRRVRVELARRSITAQPGPWGADAPPAPEPTSGDEP